MFYKNYRSRVVGCLAVVALLVIQGCSGSPETELPGKGPMAARANNQMAFRLFAEIAKRDQHANIFFSPFSISNGVGMTLLGADGETESQIKEALQVPESYTTLKYCEAMGDVSRLVEQEKGASGKVTCLVANSLWADKTYPFDQAFLDSVQKYYGTGKAFEADFVSDLEKECDRINEWVSDHTNAKITKAVSPEEIRPKDSDAQLYLALVNAIYFKGEWQEPFDENSTWKQGFYFNSTDHINVPIMGGIFSKCRYAAFGADGRYFKTPDRTLKNYNERTSEVWVDDKKVPITKELIELAKQPHYPKSDGFHMVELPYKGDRLSMIVIAPLAPDGLPRLEEMLTAERFSQWIDKLDQREIEVYLPRFKMETDYSLIGLLQSLGMKNAFERPGISFDSKTETGANFSRMTQGGKPDLWVEAAIHKAVIEVNEKGTEAAAVSSMAMAGGPPPAEEVPFVPVFKADRPFLFFICDRPSHTILFVGRVKRP